MPTDYITPDEFLTRLTQCFVDPSSKGSIWLTHKRYLHGQEDQMDVGSGAGPSGTGSGPEFEVLLRCVQKEGPKFSTRIPSSSLPTFHARYGALLKASMAPQMRKRDKKKEKAKAEAVAKKRKELYVDVNLGSRSGDKGKRGAGRRQRQRKIKAQLKKEAERERVELLAEKRGGPGGLA